MTRCFLASKSPRRAELLRQGGIEFEIRTMPCEEVVGGGLAVEDLVIENARRKAQLVAERFPGEWVLGADTVIALDDEIIGKPRDLHEAKNILRKLAGRTHEVVTGVAIFRAGKEPFRDFFAEHTQVTFLPLSDEVIEQYLKRVEVLDKAGAYALQEHGEMLIASVVGDRDNVVGLPLRTFLTHWRHALALPCACSLEGNLGPKETLG